MKDISKALVYLGIFAIPAIVLIISNSLFFPFITGKNFAFRIIVEVAFAAWILLAFYEPAYRPKFSWILASIAGLLGVMFFSNLLGEHPLSSFMSNFERMEGYVTLVHFFVYVVVAGSVLTTDKLWNRFFITSISVAVMLSLYAFAQLSGNITINQGGWRLDGTLGNSSYMAIYMLFHVFITLYLFLRTKSTGARYIYGALILLFVYLLVQTATRGTILGLMIGSFVMVTYIALFAREYPVVRKIATGGIVALIAFVALFITFKESAIIQNNPYLQRVASISFKEAATRFDIWSMAYQGVKEHPVLGWGQGNYNYVFNKYYEPELHGQEAWFDRVHNIVMDWLIAGGFLGLIAYFSIFAAVLYYLVIVPITQKNSPFSVVERGVLIGILAGYLVHNFVVFDNIVSYIFFGTILALIHSRVATPIVSIEKAKIDVRLVGQVVTPVVALFLFSTIYYVNVPNIHAAGDIIEAFRAKDPNVMLDWFDTALGRNSFGSQEIREQLTQRVQSILQDETISEEVKKKAMEKVEQELIKQIEEKPGDARIEVFISSFYRMVGDLDKAIVHLDAARALSPKKQLIIFEQGFAHMEKKEYEKAMEFFREAYDLSPQFMDVKINYAMSAFYAGKTEIVDEIIVSEEDKNAFARNDYVLQGAYNMKNYTLLFDIFERRIKINPDNTQDRTSYAYVLSEAGENTRAVEVLKKAGEDIPSFKEKADEYIKSLTATSTLE